MDDKVEQGYVICYANDTQELITYVNNRLARGYVLYGFPYRENGCTYQALVLPKCLQNSQTES